MRRLFLLLFVLIAFRGNSQQNRFAFFQAAANEPFYIRVGDQIISSNSFGSLVLPKLKDTIYTLYIGLPRNKASEQVFQVPISGLDRGFEIKKAADGSLRLYDWQKMSFIDPAIRPAKAPETPTQAKTDNYSKLMAGVVDDPAVAMSTIPAPIAAPTDTEALAAVGKTTNESIGLTADTLKGVVKDTEK